MLILTRRIGECLKIGSDITVTIINVKGLQVRIVSAHRRTFLFTAKRLRAGSSAKKAARNDGSPKRESCL
jgi:sRNA-binding carbon storage regulator CsrA